MGKTLVKTLRDFLGIIVVVFGSLYLLASCRPSGENISTQQSLADISNACPDSGIDDTEVCDINSKLQLRTQNAWLLTLLPGHPPHHIDNIYDLQELKIGPDANYNDQTQRKCNIGILDIENARDGEKVRIILFGNNIHWTKSNTPEPTSLVDFKVTDDSSQSTPSSTSKCQSGLLIQAGDGTNRVKLYVNSNYVTLDPNHQEYLFFRGTSDKLFPRQSTLTSGCNTKQNDSTQDNQYVPTQIQICNPAITPTPYGE